MPVPNLPKVGAPPAPALFSNDYPYEDYAESAEFIDTAPISESDRRKIAYENARALYML